MIRLLSLAAFALSTLLALLMVMPPHAPAAELEVSVKAENDPVKSDVILIDAQYKRNRLGRTDDAGILPSDHACTPADLLEADPLEKRRYATGESECGNPSTHIEVYPYDTLSAALGGTVTIVLSEDLAERDRNGADTVARGFALSDLFSTAETKAVATDTLLATLRDPPSDHALLYLSAKGAAALRASEGDDALQQLQPVATLYASYAAILVNRGGSYATAQDFAKPFTDTPDKTVFATTTAGEDLDRRLLAAMHPKGLKKEDIVAKTYASTGDALKALRNKEVDAVLVDSTTALDLEPDDALVPIAVSSARRIPTLQEVPTFREAELPLVYANWRALFASAKTAPVTQRAYRHAVATIKSFEMWQAFRQEQPWSSFEADGLVFRRFLQEDLARSPVFAE